MQAAKRRCVPATKVFTDASFVCSEDGPRAGIGVYWDDDDARNVSKLACFGSADSNAAEVEALAEGLRSVHEDMRNSSWPWKRYCVITDSEYASNTVTSTMQPRKCTKPWATQEYKDMVWQARKTWWLVSPHVRVRVVKAHTGIQGNTRADSLARVAVGLTSKSPKKQKKRTRESRVCLRAPE